MIVEKVESSTGTVHMVRNSERDVQFWLVRDADTEHPRVTSVQRNGRHIYVAPTGPTGSKVLRQLRKATSTEVADAVAAFDAVTQRYADFGASDTEPRAEFSDLFEAVVEGRSYRLPRSVRDWQIFDSETMGRTGSGEAARELTKAAKKVVEAVKRNPAEARKVYEHRYGYVPFGARQDGVW